ncbi:histone deacetylase complex [Salix suchowensis]|nr:histone deacetylase complex [Salix suchowensis]
MRRCTFLSPFLAFSRNIVARRIFLRGKKPKDEVQIYTWKNATLRQSTDLMQRLSFSFIFPDKNGLFLCKTDSHRNGKLDDNKALDQLGFQIGDYLDVAILWRLYYVIF